MSLNLNCEGKLENEGPHPPSGLSFIVGRENEDMVCSKRQGEQSAAQNSRLAKSGRAHQARRLVPRLQLADEVHHEVCPTCLPHVSLS